MAAVEAEAFTPTKAAEGTAQVLERIPLTHDITRLVLRRTSPEVFRYRPGQFINLVVPSEGPRPLLRSYSLAGDPRDLERLELWFDADVGGPGTTWLNGLRVGDEVRFKGPLGIFGLRAPSNRPRILVAHVSSIGTLLRLAEQALEQSLQPVTLIYEPRRESELLGVDRLVALTERYVHFHPVVTCQSGSPEWKGPRRSLLDETLRRIADPSQVEVYAAGLGSLIVPLKGALRALGVPNEQLILEKWSRADEGP